VTVDVGVGVTNVYDKTLESTLLPPIVQICAILTYTVLVVVNESKLNGDEQLFGVGVPKFQLTLSYEYCTIIVLQFGAGVK
jgi:hypothetical protein